MERVERRDLDEGPDGALLRGDIQVSMDWNAPDRANARADSGPGHRDVSEALDAVLGSLGVHLGTFSADDLHYVEQVARERVLHVVEHVARLRDQESRKEAALAEAQRALDNAVHDEWLRSLCERPPVLDDRPTTDVLRSEADRLERELAALRAALRDQLEALAALLGEGRRARILGLSA
ncbi:MAG: hypothetical protein IPM29_31015 [Planctomycetes bacterium]|nr:hypothetical protein [Planctomycetota bacterium]